MRFKGENMKKELILLTSAIIIISTFLSGCNNGDADKVELVKYDIDPYIPFPDSPWKHTYINGTIKNIAGELLEEVIMIISFYDINDTLLYTKNHTFNNLTDSSTEDFKVIYNYTEEGYEIADWDKTKFEFVVE